MCASSYRLMLCMCYFVHCYHLCSNMNADDVHVGGLSNPTGFVFSGSLGRTTDFQLRAEADQIGQEGDEVFQIPLSASPGTVPVFICTFSTLISYIH